MRKGTNRILIVALLFALASCASPTARVPVMRPAEVNLSGMNKIAVGHFDGRGGREVADMLTAKLIQTNYFEVMNRGSLGRVLEDRNLDLISVIGMINPDTAAQFRNLIGVDIIATGKVRSYTYTQTRTKSDPRKGKDGKDHRTYYKNGTAVVTVDFRITNLKDGNILVTRTLSRKADAKTSAEDKWPASPDRRALLDKASRAVVAGFVKKIAPHWEYVTVRFAKNETKLPEMENGINYAKAGQWGNAAEQFEAAVRKEPHNQGAWYNLGLSYEYLYRFQKAESAFKKASTIKPCKRCVNEINNVRRLATDRKTLEAQGAI